MSSFFLLKINSFTGIVKYFIKNFPKTLNVSVKKFNNRQLLAYNQE